MHSPQVNCDLRGPFIPNQDCSCSSENMIHRVATFVLLFNIVSSDINALSKSFVPLLENVHWAISVELS